MTAIGCRAATAGVTSRPVSGAGTETGVGTGVGVGDGVGLGGGGRVRRSAGRACPSVVGAGVAVGTWATAEGRAEAAGLPSAVAPMPTTRADTTTTPTIPMVAFRCIPVAPPDHAMAMAPVVPGATRRDRGLAQDSRGRKERRLTPVAVADALASGSIQACARIADATRDRLGP